MSRGRSFLMGLAALASVRAFAETAWAQTEYTGSVRTRIESPSPRAFSRFGFNAVAKTSVFVSSESDPRPGGGTGRVYRYEKTASGWACVGDVNPVTGEAPAQFGFSLFGYEDLLLVDSNELAGPSNPGALGAVYVFARSGTAFNQLQRIPNPLVGGFPQFGFSLSTDGTWLVIGARNASYGGRSQGVAFVYRRNASGSFAYQQALTAPASSGTADFASGVSVSDSHIAVTDLATPLGHVYLYALDTTGRFSYQQTLVATGANCPVGGVFCSFSFKAPMSKTTLFASAGATGDLYWYERSSSTWSLMRRWRPATPGGTPAGNWLAIHPGLMIASATDSGGLGAAFLYFQEAPGPAPGAGWGLVDTLLPDHTRIGTSFGQPVALGPNLAVVGAVEDSLRAPSAGAAYIFELQFAHAPRFDSAPLFPTTVHQGGTFTYSVTVFDADGGPLTLSLTAAPPWLTLTSTGATTGVLSGAAPPGSLGPNPVTLRVTDPTGRSATQSFTLSVVP